MELCPLPTDSNVIFYPPCHDWEGIAQCRKAEVSGFQVRSVQHEVCRVREGPSSICQHMTTVLKISFFPDRKVKSLENENKSPMIPPQINNF